MPKNKVSEWSGNPADNLDVGGIDIAEGCAPSNINNAIREVMAQVKDMQAGADGDAFAVGSATTNANLSVFGNVTATGNLSVTGTSTLTGLATATAGVVGDIFASNGTSKVLENGTDGTNATFTGSVTGTATTATNIAGGDAGRIPYNTAAGATAFIAAGTAGQVLLSSGTSAPSFGSSVKLGTVQNLTSFGSAVVTFSSIPSWVNRITVMFSAVSSVSGGSITVQLGTSSGTVTTGYSSINGFVQNAAATNIGTGSSAIGETGVTDGATLVTGTCVISRVSGNSWIGVSQFGRNGDTRISFANASITLAAALDRVVVTSGSNFDAGSINILFE